MVLRRGASISRKRRRDEGECPLRVIRVAFVMSANVCFQGDFGHGDFGWWIRAARDSRLQTGASLHAMWSQWRWMARHQADAPQQVARFLQGWAPRQSV